MHTHNILHALSLTHSLSLSLTHTQCNTYTHIHTRIAPVDTGAPRHGAHATSASGALTEILKSQCPGTFTLYIYTLYIKCLYGVLLRAFCFHEASRCLSLESGVTTSKFTRTHELANLGVALIVPRMLAPRYHLPHHLY